MSVALTGPAVFAFTAPSSPERHRALAEIFAPEKASKTSDADLAALLYDSVAKFLDGLNVPRGLKAVGYNAQDVEKLVRGAMDLIFGFLPAELKAWVDGAIVKDQL